MAAIEKTTSSRRPESAAWYLALIVILASALIVWAVLSLKTDLFTEAMKQEKVISLLIVIDEGTEPVVTEVFFFHPITKSGALIDFPGETGMLLSKVDRVDRLSSLYNQSDTEDYADAVGDLLGNPVDFLIRMDLDGFERLVDIIGGIDIFVPNAIDETSADYRFLFPPGSVRMDGAKAKSYLVYHPESELISERTDREHRVIQSLLKALGNKKEMLASEDVLPFIDEIMDSDLDESGLISFIGALSELDADRIVYQGILGNRRRLEGRTVLFPYYDGKLIKETVQRINETLARTDEFSEDLRTIRVEILNGTNVNGLASRTAQVFQSFGFRISDISNADRDDYERTVVLDRRGNPEAAGRVADLIRCSQVHSRVDGTRDETVDVTVILGKDFDGRFVKE